MQYSMELKEIKAVAELVACYSLVLSLILLDHLIDLIGEGGLRLEERRDGESDPNGEDDEVDEDERVDACAHVALDWVRKEVEVVHRVILRKRVERAACIIWEIK